MKKPGDIDFSKEARRAYERVIDERKAAELRDNKRTVTDIIAAFARLYEDADFGFDAHQLPYKITPDPFGVVFAVEGFEDVRFVIFRRAVYPNKALLGVQAYCQRCGEWYQAPVRTLAELGEYLAWGIGYTEKHHLCDGGGPGGPVCPLMHCACLGEECMFYVHDDVGKTCAITRIAGSNSALALAAY